MATLAAPAITVPDDGGYISDSGSTGTNQHTKFPHTRAQLAAIAREYRSTDSYEGEGDGDDLRVDNRLLYKVVGYLEEENEDGLKILLKSTYGPIDGEVLEQHVLELMHKHRDDIAGVPFLFLTSARRPISRPSSRASSHSFRLAPGSGRPETPTSAPSSPLAQGFRRPGTPAGSPLAQRSEATSYMNARTDASPIPSPILVHSQSLSTHAQYTASLPSSPLSSPRILNAKASEFRPVPRPLSAASSNPGTYSSLRADTPSPDMWSHNLSRPSSNLAIAAPLTPDTTLLTDAHRPGSSLRRSSSGDVDEDDDPFNPFAKKTFTRSFSTAADPVNALEFDAQWPNSSNSPSSAEDQNNHYSNYFPHPFDIDSFDDDDLPPQDEDIDPDAAALLTDGMTPFDVLTSVFGSTLAPSELEEALANNGYDFERAMAWLVDQALPQPPQRPTVPGVRGRQMAGGLMVVPRDQLAGRGRGFERGAPRHMHGRQPGGNRVCRYFLAGECLRADCRFSHDLERALCRFWLRGTCAKGETCEFLHRLPEGVDISALTNAVSRTNLSGHHMNETNNSGPPVDDFPALNPDSSYARGRGQGPHRGGYVHDPGRTRFAAAVKRTNLAPVNLPLETSAQQHSPATLRARREVLGPANADGLHNVAIIAPRPSPRIRLRPPTLVPTLPTGDALNVMYMNYRSRALQLGAARNACLSRAADAWRRGDGAAAKRFSREGAELNQKMSAETAMAASKLVKERANLMEQAVRARDANWSDDPGDRTARGRICGGGLGVCLGIAGSSAEAEGKRTADERMEVALELHGLHSNEATEVLEQFLLALEREHFYGLAYVIVGEGKHVGTQDVARGASRHRLAAGVREWLHHWGYPWSERDGIICVDALTHVQ